MREEGFYLEYSLMRVVVDCYSGYKADERPVRFYLGESKLEIVELLDRWYGEHCGYFKVLAEDGNTYILMHRRAEDKWELACTVVRAY
jgi:hypothetical protein